MQPNQAFGYEQIFTELLRGVVDAVSDKAGLSPERKAVAQNTAVCSVMAFNPRDPVETMLAGQCVVYDHLLRDGAKEMLRGQAEQLMIKARPGVLAAGKMFLGALGMLLRMQRRPEAQLAFARPLPAEAEAPKQPEPAPVDAAEGPRVTAHEEIQPPKHATPVQPTARPASAAVSSPAVPMPTPREVRAPEMVEKRMLDISDPAVREEIAAAIMLGARGGR